MTDLVPSPRSRPAVVELDRHEYAVELSNRDLELIRRQVNVPRNGRPPNDDELEGFARYCIAQRLNPFDRQIYLAHIGGRWQPFTGVHGRLVIALRTGEVEGMEGPYFCHARTGHERSQPPDWDELWDELEPPHAAKFVVYRKGWTRHPAGVAPWRYYNRDVGTWLTNPPLMLAYKAITRALNLVFPDVMPPAPDRAEDEPDVDESQGYVRADGLPAEAASTADARQDTLDARPVADELDLTPAALLVALRRLADDLDRVPPTSLEAVPADLVSIFRRRAAHPSPRLNVDDAATVIVREVMT